VYTEAMARSQVRGADDYVQEYSLSAFKGGVLYDAVGS
jgi:hypothetical protein